MGIIINPHLLLVFRQPHGEMLLPAEFTDDDISVIRKRVAHFDCMVTALDIVPPVLLVFCRDESGVQGVGTMRHDTIRFRLVMKGVL